MKKLHKNLILYFFIIFLFIIFILFFKIKNNKLENFNNNKPYTQNNLKIYFINLDANIDRWYNIEDKLNNIVRFNAINGKELNKTQLIERGIVSEKNKLLPGQLGCALSHISVMNLIKNQNEEYGLILEDDVIIPHNFDKIFKDLMKDSPKNWDVIFLGGCNIYGKKYNEKFIIPLDNNSNNNNNSKNLCMHAVLLNKNNIDTILKLLKPLYRPVDSQLRTYFDNLDVFYAYPNIINQNKDLISNRRVLDGLPQSQFWKKNHENVTLIE
jgi:glycosyl transferase family 25